MRSRAVRRLREPQPGNAGGDTAATVEATCKCDARRPRQMPAYAKMPFRFWFDSFFLPRPGIRINHQAKVDVTGL